MGVTFVTVMMSGKGAGGSDRQTDTHIDRQTQHIEARAVTYTDGLLYPLTREATMSYALK